MAVSVTGPSVPVGLCYTVARCCIHQINAYRFIHYGPTVCGADCLIPPLFLRSSLIAPSLSSLSPSLAGEDDYAIDIFSFGICALEVRQRHPFCVAVPFRKTSLSVCVVILQCVFVYPDGSPGDPG